MKDLKELKEITKAMKDINLSIKGIIKNCEKMEKLEEKPKTRTVRDLKWGDISWYTYSNGKIRSASTGKSPKHLLYLTLEEGEKYDLRRRIECELDCDSVIEWDGKIPTMEDDRCGISRTFIMDGRFQIELESYSPVTIVSHFGLFGAVNFPTKESLIKSINTHKKLLCEYFEVTDFEIV